MPPNRTARVEPGRRPMAPPAHPTTARTLPDQLDQNVTRTPQSASGSSGPRFRNPRARPTHRQASAESKDAAAWWAADIRLPRVHSKKPAIRFTFWFCSSREPSRTNDCARRSALSCGSKAGIPTVLDSGCLGDREVFRRRAENPYGPPRDPHAIDPDDDPIVVLQLPGPPLQPAIRAERTVNVGGAVVNGEPGRPRPRRGDELKLELAVVRQSGPVHVVVFDVNARSEGPTGEHRDRAVGVPRPEPNDHERRQDGTQCDCRDSQELAKPSQRCRPTAGEIVCAACVRLASRHAAPMRKRFQGQQPLSDDASAEATG